MEMIFFAGTEIPVLEIPEMIMSISFLARHKSEEEPVEKVFIYISPITAPVAEGIQRVGNAKGLVGDVFGEQVGKGYAATAIASYVDNKVVDVLVFDGSERSPEKPPQMIFCKSIDYHNSGTVRRIYLKVTHGTQGHVFSFPCGRALFSRRLHAGGLGLGQLHYGILLHAIRIKVSNGCFSFHTKDLRIHVAEDIEIANGLELVCGIESI